MVSSLLIFYVALHPPRSPEAQVYKGANLSQLLLVEYIRLYVSPFCYGHFHLHSIAATEPYHVSISRWSAIRLLLSNGSWFKIIIALDLVMKSLFS